MPRLLHLVLSLALLHPAPAMLQELTALPKTWNLGPSSRRCWPCITGDAATDAAEGSIRDVHATVIAARAPGVGSVATSAIDTV